MPGQSFYVLPEEQFKYLLENECKRAQRYQFFFSLLIISLVDQDSQYPFLTEISSLLKNVIRDCDTIGVLRSNQIAILLWYADNPSLIARRIINQIQQEMSHLNIEVGEGCFPVNATTANDLFRESVVRIKI